MYATDRFKWVGPLSPNMARDYAKHAAEHDNADSRDFDESCKYVALFGSEEDRIAAQAAQF